MILVAIPAAALAVVSLVAFGGRWVWWLDVLANFRPHYLAALTVMGLVLMMSRWKRVGIAALAAASINLALVAPLFLGSPGEAGPEAASMRVMSFNLLSTNKSYAEVLGYIEAVDPDLVLLHEASRPWEAAVESLGPGYEVIRPRSDDLIFGTLVLVRGAETDSVSYGFAETQPRAVEIAFRPEGWPVRARVLSTHPLAPTGGARARLRDEQLGFAAEWAARQGDGPFAVVGDFNATPWSWPFRKMMSQARLQNSQIGFGLQPSYPSASSPLLRVPIDHLLHSDALVVGDRRLGPAMGSDHFPLIVDLHLTP